MNEDRRFYASKRRYRLKKSAKNEFTAVTGIRAVQLLGGSNCIAVGSKTIKSEKPCRFAYRKYNKVYELNEWVNVYTTCGVLNCVSKEHIVAEYKPTKNDLEYIGTYHKVNSLEEMAHYMRVPVQVYEVWYNNVYASNRF